MSDLLADLDLMEAEPKATTVAHTTVVQHKAKWYQRHDPETERGWRPEPDDMTLAPKALADCNANQIPSLCYAVAIEVDAAMAGAQLYYPLFGALWRYRGTFQGHDGARYYEVECVNTIPGCGIQRGSVWSAEAGRFRRIA